MGSPISGFHRMWIDKYLPQLRRHPTVAAILSGAVISAAVGIKLLSPTLPPFLTLFPAVLLCALFGGKWIGRIGFLVCLGAGAMFAYLQPARLEADIRLVSVFGFALAAGLIVFVIELLDKAIARLQFERRKLDLVLSAAGAATWELYPDRHLHWDENFFRLVGLNPSETAPSTESFLAMVHPDDRPALAEARDLMNKGIQPKTVDEYRLIRPDGSTVWLENRRVRGKSEEYFFIGITQDITRRKNDEEQIRFLLKELAHRVKNQFAVISRIAIETRNQTQEADEFAELFRARMQGLARSNDLLVKGGETGVDLRALLMSQFEDFASAHRVSVAGPDLMISPKATQYIAMAFHELATNALKYGSLSTETGALKVGWVISESKQDVTIIWEERLDAASPERANPKIDFTLGTGFGSVVLLKLTPAALGGKATLEILESGVCWKMTAPLAGIKASD